LGERCWQPPELSLFIHLKGQAITQRLLSSPDLAKHIQTLNLDWSFMYDIYVGCEPDPANQPQWHSGASPPNAPNTGCRLFQMFVLNYFTGLQHLEIKTPDAVLVDRIPVLPNLPCFPMRRAGTYFLRQDVKFLIIAEDVPTTYAGGFEIGAVGCRQACGISKCRFAACSALIVRQELVSVPQLMFRMTP
jgi:hypothetical protein